MLFELLLVSQLNATTLVDRADSRNAAFVSCLFAVSRDARSMGLAAEYFEQKLSSACRSEEEELRAVSVSILQRRGHSAAEASERTATLLREARRSVVTAYRQPY